MTTYTYTRTHTSEVYVVHSIPARMVEPDHLNHCLRTVHAEQKVRECVCVRVCVFECVCVRVCV